MSKVQRQFVGGLDTIRFICALWVVIGHLGTPPILLGIDKSQPLFWFLNGLYNNLFNGPPAVIVFFVISGFCIHFAHSETLRISSHPRYFLRRYLRILIPMACAAFIAHQMNVSLTLFQDSILWSLLAELIYYTLYPGLLYLRRSLGSWMPLIVISFVAGLLLASTDPRALNYPSFGPQLNWLLGLPCWLLGCQVAEQCLVPSERQTQWFSIWLWRTGILLLSMVCNVLRFHSPIGYPWTLNFFAIAASFWLLREITYYQTNPTSRTLEWAGSWSYSLYLAHVPAIVALKQLEFLSGIPPLANWLITMSFILATSIGFAILVEYPSHRLARILSAKWPTAP